MTDSKQAEIDKILRRLVNRVEQYAFQKWDSQPKDYPPGFRDVLFTQDIEDEAAEALLDWHNKQVLEIIGDDQSQKRPEGGKNTAEWTNGRNNLRQQQRNKLKG